MDRGGGRGCQPGPGLSSGSLFLPRVSLGAAGDNVALSGVAGGGGTRRTERYPPGPLRWGLGGLGGGVGEQAEILPGTGRGGPPGSPRHLFSPPEGAPKEGRCPALWLLRRQPWHGAGASGLCPSLWPLDILPAWLTWVRSRGPPHCLWLMTDTRGPTTSPHPTARFIPHSPVGSFVPGRSLLPFIHRDWGIWTDRGEGGYRRIYCPTPHFCLPFIGNENILPQPFLLSPAPGNSGLKMRCPNHTRGPPGGCRGTCPPPPLP